MRIVLAVLIGALQIGATQGAAAQSQPANSGDVEFAAISFEEPLEARGPIWVHIYLPSTVYIQYPVGISPGDLGCSEFEVRRNGVLLPRRLLRVTVAVASGGLVCGSIGIRNHPMTHPGRLPLHLQYNLDSPGIYEVRYTYRYPTIPGLSPGPFFQSAWTSLEIRPTSSTKIGVRIAPQDPAEILSDFLPSILAQPDRETLSIVARYLYDPESAVRMFASSALGYWSAKEVAAQLTDLARAIGPSDVVAHELLAAAPDLAQAMMRYLGSNNPVLVRGALTVIKEVMFDRPKPFSSDLKTEAHRSLLFFAENIVRVGDGQSVGGLAAALGTVPGRASHDLLWDFVRRRIAYEQSLIAITWHKNPADLPRLATLLASPAATDPLSTELSALPYALRNAYGAAALPALEAALRDSGYTWVRVACAKELVAEKRPVGFAFVRDAIEQNRRYKNELMDDLLRQFPQLRGASERDLLAFLNKQSN